jgi:excinuclease ABC subunit C
LSYFLEGCEHDKSGRIVQSTASIVWETQPSEFAALLREQALIRTYLPRFNVQGIPRRQQSVYVCLGRKPAEHLYTAKRFDPHALAVLGPLQGAARAARAVEVVNRLLRLRDCNTTQSCSFQDQMQLFDLQLRPGCIRLEIGTCLGPCVSACTRQEYGRAVNQAAQLLAGRDLSVIEQLQSNMRQAAANLHFEQATRIREDLSAVSWLCRRSEDLAQARQRYSFVYITDDISQSNKRQVWYLIRHGMIEGSIAGPANRSQQVEARQRIAHWWEHSSTVGAHFTRRPETLPLVASWFRNKRQELNRTLAIEHIDSSLASAASVCTEISCAS